MTNLKQCAALLSDAQVAFTFEMVVFDANGPHHDLNVLGMDYMLKCGGNLRVVPETLCAELTTSK